MIYDNVDAIEFYKESKNKKIWWVNQIPPECGSILFSFDKKTIYNIYGDYDKLTKEEKNILAKEEPMLAALYDDSIPM